MGVLAFHFACLGECHLEYNIWLPSMERVDLAFRGAILGFLISVVIEKFYMKKRSSVIKNRCDHEQ